MYKKGKQSILLYEKLTLLLSSPAESFVIQLFRYTLAGGAAALVDWLFYYYSIIFFGFHYLVAAIFSFTVATAVNYIISVNWVFNRSGRFSRNVEIGLVYIISFAGLLINSLFLIIFIEFASIHFMWAKIFATGIVFVWNFALRKYYVFKTLI